LATAVKFRIGGDPGSILRRLCQSGGDGQFSVPLFDCGGQFAEQRGAVATVGAPMLTGEQRRLEVRQALQDGRQNESISASVTGVALNGFA
jgi:hypothetical protein